MGFLQTSIKRPLTIFMIVFMVMLFGMYVFFRIPVELFPSLDLPVVTVKTIYPGASPEEVEQQVAVKIEEEMSDLENLDTISSTSSQNVSQVMIQFNWGTDLNVAESQVRSKLETIRGDLPSTIEDPVVETVNPSDTPVVELVLVGEQDIKTLTTIAENQVKDELQKVKGVSSVEIFGGRENEARIELDQNKLAHLGISVGQIQQILQKDNITLAVGSVDEGKKSLTVKTQAEVKNLYELENLPIPNNQGIPLHLKDLGKVTIQEAETDQSSLFNGKNTVSIFVFKQSGSNTIDVAKLVRDKAAEVQQQLSDVTLEVTGDSSVFIDRSIKNLTKEGLLGATLATFILYFFLGELAATLVVGLAIPISIITTFLLMYLSGLTINLVTLGAITLSIGLMVDDAVVVLQNIYRHHKEEGKGIMQAAIEGTKEIGSAVFASTVTKMIVFLPMLFVGGMAGQIFRPLAFTVIFGLFASLVVSFTVTPTLTAIMLALSKSSKLLQKEKNFSGKLDRYRVGLENSYRNALVWSINNQKKVYASAVIALVLGAALVPQIGKEFLPKMDAGEFVVHVEMAPGTRVEETEKVVRSLLEKLEKVEEKENTYVGLGATQSNPEFEQSDKAFIKVKLKEKAERDRSTAEIIETFRSELAYPGVSIKVKETGFVASSLFSSDPIFISVKGESLVVLDKISRDITNIVRDTPGVKDPDNSLGAKKMEYVIRFDKDKLKTYGLDVLQVSKMMKTAIDGEVIGELTTDTGDIDIRVTYDRAYVRTIQDLPNLLIATPSGQIPLGAVMKQDKGTSPSDIYRENQLRMSFVTADLYNADLGTVVGSIQDKLADYPLPSGYTIEFGGETKDMQESFGDLGIALILAIVLIYSVMVAEFENFKHPFIIMFTIPLTLFGITSALLLLGKNLSVSSILGIIMLTGIIVSNGIVMIEYMKQLRERGMNAYDAVLKAGPIRLTPILMTTGTATLGMLPVALGLGEGSEMNAPMATVVLGGLTVGTLLTLFVIPNLYYAMEKNTKHKPSLVERYSHEETSDLTM